jgi:hypothetical protein
MSDAADAGHRYEPVRGDEIQDLADLLFPADQLGNRLWYVGRRQDRCGLRSDRANGLARARRHHMDLAGELVAASGDRADQLALRPEGSAQSCNLGCQTIVFDDPARPYAWLRALRSAPSARRRRGRRA